MSTILKKEEIKELFSDAVYKRGYTYYNQGRVRGLYFDPIHEVWHARVLKEQKHIPSRFKIMKGNSISTAIVLPLTEIGQAPSIKLSGVFFRNGQFRKGSCIEFPIIEL